VRALVVSLFLLGACSPTPEIESGQYQIPIDSGAAGGARIRLDSTTREITMLGGCSADVIVYRLNGARLAVVEEAVTSEACFDGGPYADDVNNRVSELLNQHPRVSLTDRGFDLLPPTGGSPVSFVRTSKTDRN